VGAQFELERALSELSHSEPSASQLLSQLRALGQVQRQITQAAPSQLAAMRSEVAGAVTQALAFAERGTSHRPAREAEAASTRLHSSLAALHVDLFEKKVLDPYLKFDSARDEEEYRKRERERQEEFDRLKSIGTPEAMNKANEIATAQLSDAEAHGAAASPDFVRLKAQTEQNNRDLQQISASPEPAKAAMATDIGDALTAAGVVLSDELASGNSIPDVRDKSQQVRQPS